LLSVGLAGEASGRAALGFAGAYPGADCLRWNPKGFQTSREGACRAKPAKLHARGSRMPTAARTRPWHAWLLGPYATSVLMGTLGGFPCPPATGIVGQSPPLPTRLLVAGPGPDSLATERGRPVRSSTPPRKRSRSPRAPSLHHLRNRDVRGQGGRVSHCKAYAKWMIARKLRAVFSSNVDAGSRVDASSARGRPGTTLRRR